MAAYDSYWSIWFAVMCMVTIFGFLAYITLLLVVLSTATLRQSPSNSFIVALSSTGILATSVVFPWALVLYFNHRSESKKWLPISSNCTTVDVGIPWGGCSTLGALHNFSIYNSAWLVSAIAIERYVSITRPFYSASAFKYGLLSTVLTVCSILLALIPNLLSSDLTCSSLYAHSFGEPIFNWIQFGIVFLIPIVIIVIMYVNIYRVAQNVRSTIRAIQPNPSSIPSTNESSSRVWTVNPEVLVSQTGSASVPNGKRNKAIRTLILTTGTYIVLWSPYWLLKMVVVIQHEDLCDALLWGVTNDGWMVVTWLMYVSISINPLLYGLLNRAIRLEIKRKLQMTRRLWSCNCGTTEPANNEDARVCEPENFWEFLERTNSPLPG
ncbi:probable G-protein coupled receptor [Daphnia carinata]|uniref:probable G-protein coupled receptor n=1 Tax=Daphnia carinata TaxID=120202 RepID=UPI00257C532F|nr:probable G-protein coupled receptor [Daphnia carinata]